MKTEEQILQELVGRENPFRVPSGYFDAFPQRMARQIRQRRRRRMLRMWYASVAASVVVAMGIWGYLHHRSTESMQPTQTIAENNIMYEELEYELITNSEIAMYLTEADY